MYTVDTEMTVVDLGRTAERRINSTHEALNKFKERLEINPLSALEWSNDAFLAAGKLDVWTHIQLTVQKFQEEPWCDEAALLERIVKVACGHVLCHATPGSRSTSMVNNLAEDAKKAGWKEVLSHVTGEWL